MTRKEALDLVDQAQRAMADANYTRAEKPLRQLLQEAIKSKDYYTAHEVAKTLTKCRRLHALDVYSILKQIDPIQAQRKVLS